jgi:hypothetical protein
MVKLTRRTRFFTMNRDGSLGDGLTFTDVPAGTLVQEANDPPGSKYETKDSLLLVKLPTVMGELYARLWPESYEPV